MIHEALIHETWIQIVPMLPPATCGVGDYALAVSHVLRDEFGIDTVFLLGNSRGESAERVEGFLTRPTECCSKEALAEALCAATQAMEQPNVLLHLSPYGYSPRGCPHWLLDGLRHWKRQRQTGRLVTMFHELYSGGPPWRKSFWYAPAQRALVGEIARESETAVTNVRLACSRLESFDPSKRGAVEVLPMPSTIGEPVAPPALSERAPAMVIFGLPGSRKRAYAGRAELESACRQLGIERVHDVGLPLDGIPARIGGARVTRHGRLDARDLSALLSQSMAGFVGYSPELLGKSSIFAAYCAHRMLPVVPALTASADSETCRGVHYYSPGRPAAQSIACDPQRIADAALEWYRTHSLKAHARLFAGLLRTSGVVCHD